MVSLPGNDRLTYSYIFGSVRVTIRRWLAAVPAPSRVAGIGLRSGSLVKVSPSAEGNPVRVPFPRKRPSAVHVSLPHAGHTLQPSSKHSSQSRQSPTRWSGRCTCGRSLRAEVPMGRSPSSSKGQEKEGVALDGASKSKEKKGTCQELHRPPPVPAYASPTGADN